MAVVYAIPKITLTVFVLVFVALRPPQVSMSLLVAGLAALAVSWTATGAHQLPIQRRTRKAKDSAAIARLYAVDLVRVAAMIAHNVFAFVLMAQAL